MSFRLGAIVHGAYRCSGARSRAVSARDRVGAHPTAKPRWVRCIVRAD